jgi:serine/threonine-protein kinase
MSGEGQRFDPWTELLQKLRQVTIGEYEIKGELGRGGMAAVFLAQDLALNRKVAIKVMLPGLTYSERMWDRFLAEARTAAKLDHPNIVYIHSVKEKDRFLYFVMKYIDGRTLDELGQRHTPLPIPVVQTILAEVARGLDYAHREGVVHRDIKPPNIMIDQKGTAIVMDFGIARAPDSQHFTQTGATIGTPAYMSPEQCHGTDTTAASDQYSLGVLAYELFAGRPPFAGSPIELQMAHMQDPPTPLRDLRPDLSLELSGAVMRMLEKRPEDRWPSLQHLVPIFARGLDPHDDAPRNHLISMVRSTEARRPSFPATPVSPSLGPQGPKPDARTPVASYPSRPSSATLPVASVALSAMETTALHTDPSLHPTPIIPTPTVEPPAATVPATAILPTPESVEPPAAQPTTPTPTTGPTRTIIAGGATVLALIAIAVWRGGSTRPPDLPAAEPIAAPAAVPSDVRAIPGDSIAFGHGSDGTRKVNGKAPRLVNPDAVALLQLTLAKPALVKGDTVHLRLDATDDGGAAVTTPQIVWTTSDPRVVRFAAPGELIAVAAGKATVTVTAGTTIHALPVVVGASKPAPPTAAKR